MRLIINQEISESNVPPITVNKLYDLIYKDVNVDDNTLDEQSNLRGNIYTPITYQEYIDFINEQYPDMHIFANDTYILFADKEIERILINKYNTGGGGIQATLTINQYNGFEQIFTSNTTIETFDELNKLVNVKKLGKNGFYGCTNLKSVNLTNLTRLDENALRNTAIEEVNCPNVNECSNSVFQECTKLKRVISIGNLSEIAYGMFSGCTSLNYIEEHALDNVVAVQGSGFNNCSSLTSISMPNLKTIAQTGMNNMTNLQSFDIPQSLISIGGWGLNGCNNLIIEDLNLPNLTSLGMYAFVGVKIKKISNLGSITEIPDFAFSSCTTLTTIKPGLLSNMTKIGQRGFNNCPLIGTIDLGSNVTYVGAYAFYNNSCDYIFRNESVPSISNDAFISFYGKVYVLDNLVDNYKAATGFSRVAANIKPLSEIEPNT